MKRTMKFTLIELLIVCAIIVMLAGLLLPSLRMAKEKSRQLTCLNNYKNLYTTVLCYTQDWNDWMPPCYMGPSSGTPYYYWPVRIAPYISNDLSYRGIFCCPSRPDEECRTYAAVPPYSCNYMYNVIGNNRYGSTYPLKMISKNPAPSKIGIMADGKCKTAVAPFTLGGSIWNIPDLLQYADLRHFNSINTLFADGHAKRDDIYHSDNTTVHLTYCVNCTCATHANTGLIWR